MPKPPKITPPKTFARTIKATPKFTLYVDTTHPPTELYWARIADLVLDPHNAKEHGERSLDALSESFLRFGQQGEIVVQRKTRIVGAGNGSVLAVAGRLGWQYIRVTLTDLEGAEFTAFCLAHNRTAEHNEWNWDLVGQQLKVIAEATGDISNLGWVAEELEPLIAEKEETREHVEFNARKKPAAAEKDMMQYRVVVICENEIHQGELFRRLEHERLNCTAETLILPKS
jgi:hypothetical protein